MDLQNYLTKIPQRHLLIYLVIMGILPFVGVSLFFMSDLEQVDQAELYVDDVQFLAEKVEKKQAANLATQKKYQGADHFYIDKNLEALELLAPEVDSLTKLIENPNFIEDDQTRKRLELLKSRQNRLTFSESNVQTTPFFKEVIETLNHPVEVNLSDLQKILTVIEGRQIGSFEVPEERPQLQVLDFKLDKKTIREGNEVFELNMKLLKREYP